ncbi:MAG: hypothetical protein ACRCY6_02660 [Bacteroidales bacterium]
MIGFSCNHFSIEASTLSKRLREMAGPCFTTALGAKFALFATDSEKPLPPC